MGKRSIVKLLVASFLVTICALSVIFSLNSAEAHLNGFNPGNIMSDYVMGNKNTMSEAQIQSFLKSMNPCNDSNLAKYNEWTAKGYQYNWRDGHFVCMADESFGGESAAHIIWQAAQDYSINPQVLIVLLQKEQGLITDTWPNSTQYAKATGFACTDSAPCDQGSAGFKTQVRKAAALFREVLDGSLYLNAFPAYSTVFVTYNKDWEACGGTNVYIENRATSALYRYTPYQPNAYAMGGGNISDPPQCGAFGNMNFYDYFTDWFGDTRLTSSLLSYASNVSSAGWQAPVGDGLISGTTGQGKAIECAGCTEDD